MEAERKAHLELLEKRASKEGGVIEDVPGDGSCFFHVIKKVLARRGVVITAEEARARCCRLGP